MKDKTKRISLACGRKHKRVRRKFTPHRTKRTNMGKSTSESTCIELPYTPPTQSLCPPSESSPILHPQSSPIPHNPYIGNEFLLGFTPLNKVPQSVVDVMKHKMYLLVLSESGLFSNINMHYFGPTLSTV